MPLPVLLDLKADCWAKMRRGLEGQIAGQYRRKDENDLVFIVEKLSTSRPPTQVSEEQCKHVVTYSFWKTFTLLHKDTEAQLQSLGLQCGPRPSPRSLLARSKARKAGKNGYMSGGSENYDSDAWEDHKREMDAGSSYYGSGSSSMGSGSSYFDGSGSGSGRSTPRSGHGSSNASTPRSGAARQVPSGSSNDSPSPRGRPARREDFLQAIGRLNLREGRSMQ